MIPVVIEQTSRGERSTIFTHVFLKTASLC